MITLKNNFNSSFDYYHALFPYMDKIGMLAWKLTVLTPECPEGRQVIVIANDITHLIGSFGPLEDQLFKVRLPLKSIYMSMFS